MINVFFAACALLRRLLLSSHPRNATGSKRKSLASDRYFSLWLLSHCSIEKSSVKTHLHFCIVFDAFFWTPDSAHTPVKLGGGCVFDAFWCVFYRNQ